MSRKNKNPNICPSCDTSPCKCAGGGGSADDDHTKSAEKNTEKSSSAIEIMIFKPDPSIPDDQRGVHENLWIKQRFDQYLSIGVYLEDSQLHYYLFEDCDKEPTVYPSLSALKQDLKHRQNTIFDHTPKLFMMGHGGGNFYGLSNTNDPSEVISGSDFDNIITDFQAAIPAQHDNVTVTLEACNTDDVESARKYGQDKSFLQRLSATHQNLTFCGTGPYMSSDAETGHRTSGGFPVLKVPITSMVGNVWKHGNSVAFHYNDRQVVVRKSKFASTNSAKELKTNTLDYAAAALNQTTLSSKAIERLLSNIATNKGVLTISDLASTPDFPQTLSTPTMRELQIKESQLVGQEQNSYLRRIRTILDKSQSGRAITDRDALVVALGLQDLAQSPDHAVFEGHDDLRDEVLANTDLLALVMISCGKVLIASPSNDALIDLLLEHGVDINSVDDKGMTALHYAAQCFYNYREEPIHLIEHLIERGANCRAIDSAGLSPSAITLNHSQKPIVKGAERVLELFQQQLTRASWTERQPAQLFNEHPETLSVEVGSQFNYSQ